MPHLEIAAIFLSALRNYFLNDIGKIAFVLPRSFFSADHHDNTRSGKAKGFKLNQIWDLMMSPPFSEFQALFSLLKSLTKKLYR